MQTIKELQEERKQLFLDVYDGKIPKRVPIETWITWDAGIKYAGLDMKEAQWNEDEYINFFDRVCADFPTDKAPISRSLRPPQFYQILESTAFVMSKDGNMQHPEVNCLEADEYDDFIADPFDYMVNTLMPRLYPALQADPMRAAITFAKAYASYQDTNLKMLQVSMQMTEKYGFAPLPPGAGTSAPMDFLADLIRSFTGIVKDIRRIPDKVEAACQAVLPICAKASITPRSTPYNPTFIPLHMGPFINQKQFERFWWPTFMQLMKHINDNNSRGYLFCEQDWTQKIDYLNELPVGTHLWFEFGDMKTFKEKVGNRHVISGFYPATMLQTATKQECIDEAKRTIDILAPGGNYIFNFDKMIYSLNDHSAQNLKAVIETVQNYGIY